MPYFVILVSLMQCFGGLTTSDTNTSYDSTASDSTIKSSASPITGARSSENIGVAVFKNDKLVGELNAIETICFLNMLNSVNTFLVTIPDPKDENSKIDIFLKPSSKHKVSVSFANGSPLIKINFKYAGKIYSMKKDEEYLDQNTLDAISASCNNYLKNQFLKYLYKTSVDFKSDINGFGGYAFSKFSTVKKYSDYNWLDTYQNANFDVNIQTYMDSGFLLTQT